MATLGIDLGTGSVKVALVDDDGAILASARESYEVTSSHPGWAESDPRAWVAATGRAIAAVAEDAKTGKLPLPSAVGFSGQMHGVVITDEAVALLRPAIIWADTRSTAQARRLARALGQDQLARLGSPAVPGFAATTLAWLRQHEPNVVGQARWFLQPKDWLRAQLGGAVATERSEASGTLLYDVVADAWSQRAMDAVGLDAGRLPMVAGSAAGAGAVRLPGFGPLPAVVGGADTACVITGLGLRDGDAFVAVGTGAQVVRTIREPRTDQSLRTHLFATVGDVGAGWYRLGAVQSAGLVLGRVLDWLGATESDVEPALADGVRADDPVFTPHLAGERTPFMNPELTGSWHGLRLATDRPAILRSVAEAIAHSVALAADAVREADATTWPDAAMLVGGGSAGRAFGQLLADATGLTLARVDGTDSAVVGAALLAAGRTVNPHTQHEREVIEPNLDRAELLLARRERMVRYATVEEAP